MKSADSRVILVAEDDDDDYGLLAQALKDCGAQAKLARVKDGDEAMDCLLGQGAFASAGACRPALILLDLNMPKRDGRQTLRDIRSTAELRATPVVVFTTSTLADDVLRSYADGANSYICKPDRYKNLIETVGALVRYWFDVARLPENGAAARLP
jgi:CheY-like chemotaxis protein